MVMWMNGTTVKGMSIDEALRLGLYEKEELQEQKYELEDDEE
jgi:flagellar biosynthesis component FlhA